MTSRDPRSVWTVSPGEEARLTPDGPSAAVVVSEGVLPLRIRREAGIGHHQPGFPGTAIRLGEAGFEVLSEEHYPDAVHYRLGPWPADAIIRDEVVYGPPFVRGVLRERQRLEERERGRRWSWLLYPLVGSLPEAAQVRECDRLGLDERLATAASGATEAVALFGLVRWPMAAEGAPAPLALLVPLIGLAVIRALSALVFHEVAGTPLLVVLDHVRQALRTSRERLDLTVIPLTRAAFWARLALPDRWHRGDEGGWIVRGMLPHLSWTGGARLRFGESCWSVEPLAVEKQRGRLLHSYRLTPIFDAEAGQPEPLPPPATAYQEEVLADVTREWDDLIFAFWWLVPLLPVEVQRRAMEKRGGPAAIRSKSGATVAVEALLAVWFVTGAGAMNLATGLVFAADAVLRLLRLRAGEYAPSLFGGLVSDYLRPERVAYQAHRDGERRALAAP